MKLKLILAISIVASSLRAHGAQPLTMATIDFPPIAIHKDGKAEGIGVEILREISKRTGIVFVEALIPINRIAYIGENDAAFYPSLTRTPERESQFHWIGRSLVDHYCFMTLKSGAAIQSLEDAKKFKSIAVNSGGATEKFLIKNGFQNLDSSTGNTFSLRKLIAKRVDAWFTGYASETYSCHEEKTDCSVLECKGSFEQPEYWIAATKKVPEAEVKQAREAFAEIEKDGTKKKIVHKFVPSL